MNRLLRTLLFFNIFSGLFAQLSFSQAPLVKQWDYRLGGSKQEWLFSFSQTSDGGFILGGSSTSDANGDKSQVSRGNWDYWVIKTNASGIKQWDKRFGGTSEDDLYSISQTRDGGYILGGSSYSQANGDKSQPNWDAGGGTTDYWIVKIDSVGNFQWDKRFGTGDWDDLSTVIQTSDGGYMLGGSTYGDSVDDKTQHNWDVTLFSHDYWIVKTDSAGNKLWDKRYGGSGDDDFATLLQTTDGGYILGGHSFSGATGDKTDTTRGGNDYWIVKIDSAGTKQWDKSYGGTGADYLHTLQQTKDKGFILGGYSTSNVGGEKSQPSWGGFYNFDFWVVKVDSVGNKQWDKDFGGTGDEDGFGSVVQTIDGGYLIAGSSYSNITGTKSESNLGPEQMWITKTDAAGNKKWDKTMFDNDHDEIGYAIQAKDGCYVMANFTAAGIGGYKTQGNWDASRQSCDFWIIKFCDSTLCLPVASFISSDSAFCSEPSKCIDFVDHSTCNPTSWEWIFTGAFPDTSSLQNPTGICYTTPGTFPVTLIVGNGTTYDTLTISPMITVGGLPSAPSVSVVGGDTLVSSYALAYQWYWNGNLIIGATDSGYVATQPGTYAVMITDSLGCTANSGGIFITGISQLDNLNGGIQIYPNPVEKMLGVRGFGFGVGAGIEILDVLGNKVYCWQRQISNTKHETVIDVSALSQGVYFIEIQNEKVKWVGRFIKKIQE